MQLQNESKKSSASDNLTYIHAIAMDPCRRFAAVDGDAQAQLCLKFIFNIRLKAREAMQNARRC